MSAPSARAASATRFIWSAVAPVVAWKTLRVRSKSANEPSERPNAVTAAAPARNDPVAASVAPRSPRNDSADAAAPRPVWRSWVP